MSTEVIRIDVGNQLQDVGSLFTRQCGQQVARLEFKENTNPVRNGQDFGVVTNEAAISLP